MTASTEVTEIKSIDFTEPTDIVLCDPVYCIPESQWAACQYGACPEHAGYTHCISAKVEAGQFALKRFYDGHTFGHLTTDSGYIGVFEVAEVLRICGMAFWDTPCRRTFISDFEGDVVFVTGFYDDADRVSIIISDAASGDVFVSIKQP